jgi:hypothetical protein
MCLRPALGRRANSMRRFSTLRLLDLELVLEPLSLRFGSTCMSAVDVSAEGIRWCFCGGESGAGPPRTTRQLSAVHSAWPRCCLPHLPVVDDTELFRCYSKRILRELTCLLLDLLSHPMLYTCVEARVHFCYKCKHRSPKDSAYRSHPAPIPNAQHICSNMFTDSARHDPFKRPGADARTPLWICHAAQSAL